jgi:hypothetical protein
VLKMSEPLPFNCTHGSVVTERHPGTGKRWLWQPDAGALAFDSSLRFTSTLRARVATMTVAPDGDGLIFISDGVIPSEPHVPNSVVRWRHDAAEKRWGQVMDGQALAFPVVRADLGLSMAVFDQRVSTPYEAQLAVFRFDVETGTPLSRTDLFTITREQSDTFVIPPVAFSPDGSVLYVPRLTTDGRSTLRACSTLTTDNTDKQWCAGLGLKWESPPVQGTFQLVMPYASGSRVAAVAQKHAYFFDTSASSSTQLLNAGGKAVVPGGALLFQGVQPGRAGDYFLLSGPQQGVANLPVEVIALDAAERGEVFRYSQPAGSVSVAIDDGGVPWMRLGSRLVRPLPLSEYRAVRSR